MTGKNTQGSGNLVEDQKMSIWPERFKLHGGEHPGMSLVLIPLDSNNFLTWSRSIKLALGAKRKLGFIDGSYTKPQENKEEMEQLSEFIVWWFLGY
ncbi:UNVERIFIED_CONTAM: hypothetical protein Sindi_0539900 [Sesamum indicum]